MDVALKNHLIEKYRESIANRYDWETIKNDAQLPEHFNKKLVTELRNFFLENLYMEPAGRDKLDAAFKQLETYIAHPTKVWALLGSLPSAIMRFGLQFPAALKAGMVALKTHTSARHFEDLLLQAAMDRKAKPPLSEAEFHACLAALPKEDLEKFVEELTEFFMMIANVSLMEKTILILQDVLVRMKKDRNVFGPEDVDAIQLGVDILEKSYALLNQYDDDMKKEIVDFVAYNEMSFLESLQAKPKKKKAAKK